MDKWEELEKAVEKAQGLGYGFSVVIAPKDLEDLLAEHRTLKAELEDWKQAAKAWENEAERRSDRYVKCAAELDRIKSLEPVQLDHLACVENGQLRYVTGRQAPQHDCELYAVSNVNVTTKLYILEKKP